MTGGQASGLPLVERLRSAYERLAHPPPSPLPGRPARSFLADAAFTTGVNLPWFAYGGDFGRNAWWPEGGVGRQQAAVELHDQLARIAGAGHRVVRWFTLCDGRSGIVTDGAGLPAGLETAVYRDIDAALDGLERAGLTGLFVLFDYLLCAAARVERGVQTGGRWRWIASPEGRRTLIEHVVVPLAAHTAGHPAVAAWDIINEPEWLTRRWGVGGNRALQPVGDRAVRAFLTDARAALHAVSPCPVTVGLASGRGLALVRNLDLDFYQVHWYDGHGPRAPLDMCIAHWDVDRPVLLGEYPTRNSQRSPANIVDAARRAGYAGALAWSARAHDHASAPPAIRASA